MEGRILELRSKGLGYKTIAKQLGISAGSVKWICKKNGVAGFTVKPEQKTEDQVKAFVHERLPSFEYAGNYTGCDSSVDIRCLNCGTVMTRSMITVRNRNVRCRVCEQDERLKREEQLRLEKEEQRKQAEQERWLNKTFKQMTMKQCPVCRAFFYGSRKYCSDYCMRQNKWHMKDGYRYLFPLREVYDRDNGICYLCGKPCDWNDYEVRDGVIIYNNNYPSRDHIIPKSLGGENTWENIRLAHRGCNARKSISPCSKKIAT